MGEKTRTQLKWKILGCIGVTGIILVFALAYNLGKVDKDNEMRVVEGKYKALISNSMRLLQTCQKNKGKVLSEEEEILTIKEKINGTIVSIDVTESVTKDLETKLRECNEDTEDLEKKKITRSQVISRLEYERGNLLDVINTTNATNEGSRRALQEQVHALSLENRELAQLLKEQEDTKPSETPAPPTTKGIGEEGAEVEGTKHGDLLKKMIDESAKQTDHESAIESEHAEKVHGDSEEDSKEAAKPKGKKGDGKKKKKQKSKKE